MVKDYGIIYVFYSVNEREHKVWSNIEDIPEKWWFVGDDHNSFFRGKIPKNMRGEEYNGPQESIRDMEKCLSKYFRESLSKNIIEKYEIWCLKPS